MSPPLILAAIWVIAATVTALLPMKRQFIPGVALLIAAPILIIWIAFAHGWIWAVIGILGFGSMFRNPLIYLLKRARGHNPEIPK